MKSIAQILESAGELAGNIVSKSPGKHAEAKAIIKGLRRNFNKGYKKAKNEPQQVDMFDAFPFDDDIPF